MSSVAVNFYTDVPPDEAEPSDINVHIGEGISFLSAQVEILRRLRGNSIDSFNAYGDDALEFFLDVAESTPTSLRSLNRSWPASSAEPREFSFYDCDWQKDNLGWRTTLSELGMALRPCEIVVYNDAEWAMVTERFF